MAIAMDILDRGAMVSASNRPDRAENDLGRAKTEHADVNPDIRVLLFSQSSRYKRQGGMEAPPDRGVPRVLD